LKAIEPMLTRLQTIALKYYASKIISKTSITMIAAFIIGSFSLIMGLISRSSTIQRNSLFGYRTFLSMKNDANWEFANSRFANHAIIIGLVSLAIGGASYIVEIQNGVIIFIILSLLLASIVTIEVKLKNFDRTHHQ
jgi:uncharacterized membrane protein